MIVMASWLLFCCYTMSANTFWCWNLFYQILINPLHLLILTVCMAYFFGSILFLLNCVSFKCIFYKQHAIGSCFSIYSNNLCLIFTFVHKCLILLLVQLDLGLPIYNRFSILLLLLLFFFYSSSSSPLPLFLDHLDHLFFHS